MLILHPRKVFFGADEIDDVSAVVVDRRAERLTVEWSDMGPHAVFADVPERRVVIRILQDVVRGDLGGPAPGDEDELVFHTAPTGAQSGRRKVEATVVITGVAHELSRKRGAVRTIECVAISTDGSTDPVTITKAEGGA